MSEPVVPGPISGILEGEITGHVVGQVGEHASMPPTTTVQQDITTASQRKVNLIWEYTQAAIALIVVLANMVTGVVYGVRSTPHGEYPPVLMSSLFLVIGFYFSRTNHAAIGGVGYKPQQAYEGR